MSGFCLNDYLAKQRQQALGNDNKWFCSQHHGHEVTDPDSLIAYYIKHGGAWRFSQENPLDAALPGKFQKIAHQG